MADLTTLAKVKEFGSTDDDDDTFVEDTLIPQASAQIERFCHRILDQQASHVEIHESVGLDSVVLREWPVDALVVVELDTTLVLDTDYELQTVRLLRRLNGTDFIGWARGRIKVTYSAGYATIPDDLESAATMHVVWLYRQSSVGGSLFGETGETTPTGTDVSWEAGKMLPVVQELLAPFVRRLGV